MVINGNVYNHLSTSLVPKQRNIAHKSSDLKAVYNKMAKYNKNSPLYLLDFSESKQSFIINIKEAAMNLKYTSEVFSNNDDSLYAQKKFYSSDTDAISGSIKSSDLGDLPSSFDLSINELATEQVNIGNYLSNYSLDFAPGKYPFSIETADSKVKFSIDVNQEDTNNSVQTKIMNAINDRGFGVKASIINSNSESALMLSSTNTGIADTENGLQFNVKANSNSEYFVSELGLNNVSTEPRNSSFTLNGAEHNSASNHIAINHVVELDFHKTTTEPVNISFIADTKVASDHIDSFINSYNSLVDLAKGAGQTKIGSRNLLNDISGIANNHISELNALGININDEGKLVKDDKVLNKSIENGDVNSLFTDISSFNADLEKATNRLTVDPMAYVNKLIVTYPNKGNKFDTPYTQSLYSGLIYNNYA